MTFAIRFSKQANSYLKRLDPATQRCLMARLREVASDPLGPGSKVLVGKGDVRSARVGDYRILLRVDDVKQEVVVGSVGPRGQIYRDI